MQTQEKYIFIYFLFIVTTYHVECSHKFRRYQVKCAHKAMYVNRGK